MRFTSESRPQRTLAAARLRNDRSRVALNPIRSQVIPLFPEWSVLRGFRIREGLTQQQVADSVGASRRTISSIERRTSVPSVALALARRFEASVEELFAVEDLR
ncbi:MAG TPA: helix-turn-helix domain-containing protein [Gaiellaceae bacterium]